jgi:SAM-dependent methyltransferase
MTLVTPLRPERRIAEAASDAAARGFDRLRLKRSEIPAVTHVDGSARVQTVDRERNPLFRRLLEAFHRRTRCPVLVNTSFNLGWDPIVRTPQDALETFLDCDLDVLCMGRFVVEKLRLPASIPAGTTEQSDPVLGPLLASPAGGGALVFAGDRARCVATGTVFEREDGIWKMFWPHQRIDDPSDVTRLVQAFYEETPFPNYDDFDSVRSLIEKSRAGIYTRALSRAIPPNSTVLEVGCGTGQLTNFLGISCRRVVGTDLCLNSLRLGERFRRDQGLERVRFVQMNLFRPCFAEQQFDVILCNGVLHHTADPFGGYQGLLPLLKPGGTIVIGLYNRFGRLMTDLRRLAFRATGGRGKWIDPMLRQVMRSEGKRRAWFADQYRHPHESKHTTDEVLGWFDETGVEFVRGVPSVTPTYDPIGEVDLFAPRPRGSSLEHAVAQLGQVFGSGQREGGLFVMIGRKPARAAAARTAASSPSRALG